MELLLGAASSILIEAFKWVNKRFGKQITKRAIYLALFALTLVWTILIHTNLIDQETVRSFVSMLLYAVGLYELVIKQVLKAMR